MKEHKDIYVAVVVKRNSAVVESCFSVGLILEPQEGWIVTSSMSPGESAKDSFYFHVHGSHL